MSDIVRKFFEKLTPEGRMIWKENYEFKIRNFMGKIPSKKNIVGKLIPPPPVMPWMMKAWSDGLIILKEVMAEKGELKDEGS